MTFFVTYFSLPGAQQGCGGLLIDRRGFLKTPDFNGDGNYEPNLDCRWVLQVPANHVVVLHTQFFALQSTTNCDEDYLEVSRSGLLDW